MPKEPTTSSATDQHLAKIVVLLAALLTSSQSNALSKVRLLAPLGLTTGEMAAACNTTEAVIRARVADLKKEARVQDGDKE